MDVQSRIIELRPTIESIFSSSGSPGLSLGVIHQGKILHTQHFGYRDVSKSAPPNDDTIYQIASLTKLITALTIGLLVDEGHLEWDVPIREYLPAFRQRKDEVGKQCTLRDLLAHRTGLSANYYWGGHMHGESILPRHGLVRLATLVEAVRPFRKSFVYSQWNYVLIQAVIEAVMQIPLDQLMKERIFDRLQMDRTTLSWLGPDSDENMALTYGARDDNSPSRITFPDWHSWAGFQAGVAVKSTIRDLLKLYQSLIGALKFRQPSLFAELDTILSPQTAITKNLSMDQAAYCFGVYRTRTPATLSMTSFNAPMFGGERKMPVTGSDCPGVEIFHHNGMYPGAMLSFYLIPQVGSAAVVLSNSTPLVDPADLVGQLLVTTLLGGTPSQDLSKLAASAASFMLNAFKQLQKTLDKDRTDIPPTLPLQAYGGEYLNSAENLLLRISVNPDRQTLRMNFQRSSKTAYDLAPYDRDTFYHGVDRQKEISELGMMPNLSPDFRKLTFVLDSDKSKVEKLVWHHDQFSRRAEEFFRIDGRLPEQSAKL